MSLVIQEASMEIIKTLANVHDLRLLIDPPSLRRYESAAGLLHFVISGCDLPFVALANDSNSFVCFE